MKVNKVVDYIYSLPLKPSFVVHLDLNQVVILIYTYDFISGI